MKRFKDLSIRKKLTLLLMGISTVAVVAACLTFYVFIVDRYQHAYVDDLHSLAAIVGSNCKASLAFDIPEDAVQLLASLNKRPSIIGATIFDNSGSQFASYRSSRLPEGKNSAANSAFISSGKFSGNLSVSQNIEMNGQKIGEIVLSDDLRSILAFRHIALIILMVIVAVIMGLTAFFAARFREIISLPISNLAEIAHKISSEQDYSLRAEKESSDEIGKLVDAFNGMLAHIAQRNKDLLKSENRFRTVINQAVDAFFLHDMAGRFTDVNQQACDILGYSRDELLNMSITDIDRDAVQYRKKYWTKMLPEIPSTIQGVFLCKDGHTFPAEVRMGLLDLGGEKLIMAVARDISERLAAEKERLQLETHLQQAQKMESIGTLAGGIAHDFNNILTPIFGYLDLALGKISADSKIYSDLSEVRKAAERARQMVKHILTFSRRESDNIAPIQVSVVVKEALKLLRASIPATIEIRQSIDSNSGFVLANPTQIHQIIMNLCTNAYQAMKETGGMLSVVVTPLTISAVEFMPPVNLRPGPYLRLEVSDTGHGIDKATRERIFEPYFTTKEKGEGTGMGLAVVHGIVKSISGHITVASEPGQGTTFNIYLPVIESVVSPTEYLLEKAIPVGTEKIMLVDDEHGVRNVERDILKGLGYDVAAFANPLEAFEFFTAHPGMFDLLITDMTMPKMTGDKLAAKVMAIRPDMPIILCTGFSDLINEESAKSLGIREYITKPIVRRSFAATVRAVLDGSAEKERR